MVRRRISPEKEEEKKLTEDQFKLLLFIQELWSQRPNMTLAQLLTEPIHPEAIRSFYYLGDNLLEEMLRVYYMEVKNE